MGMKSLRIWTQSHSLQQNQRTINSNKISNKMKRTNTNDEYTLIQYIDVPLRRK